MILTARARTRSLAQRHSLAWLLGMSALLAQIFLPGLDSTRWSGVWLLLLPVTALYLSHCACMA